MHLAGSSHLTINQREAVEFLGIAHRYVAKLLQAGHDRIRRDTEVKHRLRRSLQVHFREWSGSGKFAYLTQNLVRLLLRADEDGKGGGSLFGLCAKLRYRTNTGGYHRVRIHKEAHAGNVHQRALEVTEGKSLTQPASYRAGLLRYFVQLLCSLAGHGKHVTLVGL